MTAAMFYDRDGNRIAAEEWNERYGGGYAKRVLVRTRLPGDVSVVTLWNGMIDVPGGVTLYASHLMAGDRFVDHLLDYNSEAAALTGHGHLVAVTGGRFFCPRCWHASSNVEDLRHGYCGRCRDNTAPPWEDRFGVYEGGPA